jgi:hypothetical protein
VFSDIAKPSPARSPYPEMSMPDCTNPPKNTNSIFHYTHDIVGQFRPSRMFAGIREQCPQKPTPCCSSVNTCTTHTTNTNRRLSKDSCAYLHVKLFRVFLESEEAGTQLVGTLGSQKCEWRNKRRRTREKRDVRGPG